jgi:2-dehydro-3-deoxyphosphogluconate aldolase/(4S)-4-hydroxy-2-oxoglutarate aldolase
MKNPSSTVSMADKVTLIDSLCAKARILPVITIAREQDILPLADALAAGGLTALEVTLRSQYGLKAIQVLREQRPELVTGAGTVLDRHMLAAAEAAGSQFIVTPGITRDLLEASVQSPIPLLPGISNASGIMEGYGLGYRRFKLFPAEVSGGVAAIKALGGPFGEVKFCPTGGVSPANIKSYMVSRNAPPRHWRCWTDCLTELRCVFYGFTVRLVGAPFFFACIFATSTLALWRGDKSPRHN